MSLFLLDRTNTSTCQYMKQKVGYLIIFFIECYISLEVQTLKIKKKYRYQTTHE